MDDFLEIFFKGHRNEDLYNSCFTTTNIRYQPRNPYLAFFKCRVDCEEIKSKIKGEENWQIIGWILDGGMNLCQLFLRTDSMYL